MSHHPAPARAPALGRLRSLCWPLLLLALSAQGALAGDELPFGILQFRTAHNLETEDCMTTQDCFLELEELDAPGPWLDEIAAYSDLAILHWDRGIPWLAFDADAPPGVDRSAFYDARLDPALVAWIDAYAAHFAGFAKRYVAVSMLSGERNQLAPILIDQHTQQDFEGSCPDLSSGASFSVDIGAGAQSFDLERAYRNFLLYLYDKLAPTYFGLVVEANLLAVPCPARADAFYALYRSLHDAVEAEVGSAPILFATLSYPPLLGYDRQACYPTSGFTSCALPPPDPPADIGEAGCYPGDTSPIDALNQGGRLDLLALSIYPDTLEMARVASPASESQAFLLDDWNQGGSCTSRFRWPMAVDPLAAIDTLGWTGPVAIAETSARSCKSPFRIDLDLGGGEPTPFVFEVAGSGGAQRVWLEQSLAWAREREFEFYAHSFLRDYPPLGVWVVEFGLIPASLQSLFNIWPCSGLQDAQGVPKPELAALGLPEPTRLPGGLAALALLVSLRRFRRAQHPRSPGA